jgi:hypothetical protein
MCSLLLRLRGIVVLVILALPPYLACLGLLLLIVSLINMIFIMSASWENTSGCHFLFHQIVRIQLLIQFILIFEHLLLLVCQILSIIWSFLIILLITYGLFHLNLNLTPSSHCPTSLFKLLLNSVALSRPSNMKMDVSLTTIPPRHFFCRKGHNFRCHVHTRTLKMVKSNTSFALLTMSFIRCLFRLPFLGTIELKGFTLSHIY